MVHLTRGRDGRGMEEETEGDRELEIVQDEGGCQGLAA